MESIEEEEDWSDCTRCELHRLRQAARRPVLFGRGTPGGIMLVGASPLSTKGEVDEVFSSDGCKGLIDTFFEKAGYTKVYYATLVACHSLKARLSPSGVQIQHHGHPVFDDTPPTKQCISSCFPRLWSEIYEADPLLILTMGKLATKTLLPSWEDGVFGEVFATTIDGMSSVPVLRRGKLSWKEKGVLVSKSVPRKLKYHVMAVADVNEAWDRQTDAHPLAPMNQLINQLGLALEIVTKYEQLRKE